MKFAVIGSRGKMGTWHRGILESMGHEVTEVDTVLGPIDLVRVAGSVDAAVIASPTPFHAEQAKVFLMADKPVLIEKPIAMTVPDAVELRTLSDIRQVPVAVGYLNRFNHAFKVFQPMMFNSGYLDIVRSGPVPAGEYGGVAMDLASHDIDLLRFTYGDDLKFKMASVRPKIATYGWVAPRYGVRGTIAAAYGSRAKVRDWRWHGENRAYLDMTEQTLDIDHLRVSSATVNQLEEQMYAFVNLMKGNRSDICLAADAVLDLRDALG